MNQVYFDNAATTPLRPEVIATMQQVLSDVYGNPSSTHSFGREAKTRVELARKTIAAILGVTASEIIFTSGGTEADNLIVTSCVRDLRIRHIVTSRIEHHAVLHTVAFLKKHFDITVSYVNLLENGAIDLTHLEEILQQTSSKTLVSLMHVNNEVGNLLDIKKAGAICKRYDALFHSDTVQSVGHFDLNFSKIDIDFAAVSAHKFHGPKGVGFAFVKKQHGLKSLIHGGEQEKGLRAGTEAVYAIVALAEALSISVANLGNEKEYILGLKSRFISGLKTSIPNIRFNGLSGDLQKSSYTIVNVLLPVLQERAVMLSFELDIKGIACSKGSACQSGSSAGSHVLQAIQSDEDQRLSSLRFSFSSFNKIEEIDYVVDVLKQFVLSKK